VRLSEATAPVRIASKISVIVVAGSRHESQSPQFKLSGMKVLSSLDLWPWYLDPSRGSTYPICSRAINDGRNAFVVRRVGAGAIPEDSRKAFRRRATSRNLGLSSDMMFSQLG